MSDTLEIRVRIGVSGVADDHPVAEEAVGEFLADTGDIPGLVVVEGGAPQAGHKGHLSEVLLLPGTASVVWGTVRVIELWLRRDRARSLTLTIQRPGESEPFRVNVSGDQIPATTLDEAIRRALGEADGEEGSSAAPATDGER